MTPLTSHDVLIGAVTSESMAYILAGLSHVRALCMLTVGITCVPGSVLNYLGDCECVIECNNRAQLNSEGERREMQTILTRLSRELGTYIRTLEGAIHTGTSDRTGLRLKSPEDLGIYAEMGSGLTIVEPKEGSESLIELQL
ncbi:hypothetical protein BD779DRAFT_308945 [Infundibulicybe gibba]|nr:hypothetical protein BD779DRAFT_308945 [Infundibulicybe gibba]